MSNKNPILLMSNYTIAIFVCISRLEKKNDAILILIFFPTTANLSSQFFSISSSFQLQFARCVSFVPSSPFPYNQWTFILKIKTVLRLSKCSSGDIKIEASSSGCRSK